MTARRGREPDLTGGRVAQRAVLRSLLDSLASRGDGEPGTRLCRTITEEQATHRRVAAVLAYLGRRA